MKISPFSPIIRPRPSLLLDGLSSPPFFPHTSFHPLHLHPPPCLLEMHVSTILLIKKDIHPHTQDIHEVMWALTIIITHPGLKTTCSLTHTYTNTPSTDTQCVEKLGWTGSNSLSCPGQRPQLQHDFLHTHCALLRTRLLPD